MAAAMEFADSYRTRTDVGIVTEQVSERRLGPLIVYVQFEWKQSCVSVQDNVWGCLATSCKLLAYLLSLVSGPLQFSRTNQRKKGTSIEEDWRRDRTEEIFHPNLAKGTQE